MAITGLAEGLRRLGHSVVPFGDPSAHRTGALHRLRYNISLALVREVAPAPDLIVGFDLDGCALRRRTAPYVVCLKGVMADEVRFERGRVRLGFQVLSRLEGANARSADVVMVTSEYSRALAGSAYGLAPERVRVVPEGIDLARWSVAPRARRDEGSRHGSGRQPAGLRILSVARQYRRKNTMALLHAIPQVLAHHPEARLRIVGDGPELPRLRRAVRSLGLEAVVDLLGAVPDLDALQAEYRRADVFCLPSLQEGFGIVFLEAMASGIPIVACRSAAVPEVVPDEEAGVLVPPDRPDALAGALVRLLGDPALRRRMGQAGTRRASQHGWETIAGRFLTAAGF